VQIDWFTLVAQVVNFIILLYLLKRFLYGPIIQVMEQRQAEVASQLEEAEEERNQARAEREHYESQQAALEEKRSEILDEAEQEAASRREEMIQQAREDVAENKKQWQEALEREKERFLQDLRCQAGQRTVEVARRVLRDLADAKLEQRIIDAFVERLSHLEQGEREDISASIRRAERPLVVRSAFDISDAGRRQVIQALESQFPETESRETAFEQEPSLICGIELHSDGRRVGWNVEEYLEALGEQMEQLLEEKEVELKEKERLHE